MSKNFDYIVIGGGLTGLIIATRLSQESDKVALIETKEFAGGHQRKVPFKDASYNNGLRFFPATQSANQGLDFLENVLGLKLSHGIIEAPPVTFEDGEVKAFLGFGDHSPAFYDEINYFLQPNFHHLTLQPHDWVELLLKNFKGTLIGRSQATQFKVENEQVTCLVVNGSQNYHAENYIYCGSMNDFVKLVPEDAMASRLRQKMTKLRGWSAVGLDLIHASHVTDSLSSHLLDGTTNDSIGPCVGRFQTLGIAPSTVQISQWLTFVDNNSLEDSETVATVLKKIKRQIKRAYPAALDSLIQERIVISPQYSLLNSQDIKLQAQQTWPAINNLWIGSPAVHQQKNLVSALGQAQLVLASMGFAAKIEMPTPIEEMT